MLFFSKKTHFSMLIKMLPRILNACIIAPGLVNNFPNSHLDYFPCFSGVKNWEQIYQIIRQWLSQLGYICATDTTYPLEIMMWKIPTHSLNTTVCQSLDPAPGMNNSRHSSDRSRQNKTKGQSWLLTNALR